MSQRTDRVDELLRQEIGALLAKEVADPRIGFATITDVETSPDLRHAKVFVSIMGSEAERAATFEGLGSVASHLRSRIGRALRLRLAPEIAFRPDESIAHAARIESLLAQLKEEGSRTAASDAPPAADGEQDA